MLFPTSLGECGIAWSETGVRSIVLAEKTSAATARRLAQLSGGTATDASVPFVRDAIRRLTRLLDGEPVDLSAIPLDLSGLPPFRRRVLEESRRIPAGETRSYGELARAAGSPGAARAVGQAMAQNPCPLIVPCHRVLAADGTLCGFSAHGGLALKERLLDMERPAGKTLRFGFAGRV